MTMPLPRGREPPAAPSPRPLTVGELTEAARMAVEGSFPPLWVEGEISNFKPYPSGHWYFSLKDPAAQVRCVMWRADARKVPALPEDGLKVFAHGQLTVSVKRGELQLVVRQLLATTEGGFYAIALERARAALDRDGLLDPARKRPLPLFPRCVGVVTSSEGAAWRDVVAVLTRRWPLADVVLIPARVQGDGAPEDLCRALGLAGRLGAVELLIIGRGGGSKEDLWAFNDERVARAVAHSRVPTISAVGHETDVTLTDLVADVRAPTPSAAALKAVPDRDDIGRRLSALAGGLEQAVSRRIALGEERLRHAAARAAQAAGAALAGRTARVDALGAALQALSPLKVLERGYAVARAADGRVLRRTADFPPGLRFRLRLADGEVPATADAR